MATLKKYSKGDRGLLILNFGKAGINALYIAFVVPFINSSIEYIEDYRLNLYRTLFYLTPVLYAIGSAVYFSGIFKHAPQKNIRGYRIFAILLETIGSLFFLITGSIILAIEGLTGVYFVSYIGLFYLVLALASTLYVAMSFVKFDFEKMQ